MSTSLAPASAPLALPLLRRSRLFVSDPLLVATACALITGTVIRACLGAGRPLWVDETFTGAIAALPNLAEVGRQILNDVNAPLYYLVAHAWSLVFGLSDASLRFPALIFSVAAPFLCLTPTSAIPRGVRLIWCMLTALWEPGLPFAQEARCYSLVFCLVVCLTISYAAIIQAPSRRGVLAWATLSCLAVLAHYHAILLVAVQAIAFIALRGRRALSCWPAAAPFVPLACWLVIASDRIRAFTAPEIAWYNRPQIGDLWSIYSFVTGAGLASAIWIAVFGGLAFRKKVVSRTGTGLSVPHNAAVAASTALAATTLVVTLAFVKPTFTMRYLMAFEPGLLLGLALIAEAARRVFRAAPFLLIALVAQTSLNAAVAGLPPRAYNFEAASDALIAGGARSLVFFWDNPDNAIEAPSQLAIVGGFFFHRSGIDVEVRPLINPRGRDPNPRLLALAAGSHPAILWVYDARIHDTAVVTFPPRIAETPGWRCRDYGLGTVGVLACLRS